MNYWAEQEEKQQEGKTMRELKAVVMWTQEGCYQLVVEQTENQMEVV